MGALIAQIVVCIVNKNLILKFIIYNTSPQSVLLLAEFISDGRREGSVNKVRKFARKQK